MTNHAAKPAVRHHANDAPPPFQQGPDASRPVRKASLIAGVALLLMAALAGFGYNFAIHGLITPGNATRTAQDIMAHQQLFRAGIACLFLVIALDVVAALALYRVFSPVSKPISAVAAAMRVVYAGIFAVAVVQLAGAARLLGGGTSLPPSGSDRVHAEALSDINRFTGIWHAGLILFGLYLLVIAWLAWRSGYVPKLLGVLIAIAGLGYIYDSIGQFVSGGSWTQVSTVTFIGEFLLALWLVIRRAGQARLTLAELDAAIGTFIREVYNLTLHSETEMAPQQLGEPVRSSRGCPNHSSSSTCCCSPWPSPTRSIRTASTSRACATWPAPKVLRRLSPRVTRRRSSRQRSAGRPVDDPLTDSVHRGLMSR